MEIRRTKGEATTITVPMLDVSAPESFLTGLTVADEPWYHDGGGWVPLAITDTFDEIGATGTYSIDMTNAEINHDLIMIKLTAAGAADSSIIIHTGSSGDVAGIRDEVMEGNNSVTLQQAISLILAAVAGVTTNNGLTFQDPSGSSNRIEATVDDDSNRTSIIITPST